MCFAPQPHATFHLSPYHMVPHLPLKRASFSTPRSHKTTKKHSVSRLSYLFAHLHLLSSDLFSNWVQTNQLSRLTSEIAPAALACPGDHSYETMNPEGHEGPRMPAVFQIAVSAFPEECPKLFQKRLFAPNSASHPMSPCEGVSVEQLN